MTFQLIQLRAVSLSFKNHLCFDAVNTKVSQGERIGLIGRNGSGKSSLLKVIAKQISPTSGEVVISSGVTLSYIEQTISHNDSLSGGQRFNDALSKSLANYPDILLLDEPTNHLDAHNRQSLMQMLKHYMGTLIIASHDKALLNNCVDTLWDCDNEEIVVFEGSYDVYRQKVLKSREHIEKELQSLNLCEKNLHQQKMREQQRAAKSRKKGEVSIKNRKWPTIVSDAKARRSQETTGKKQRKLSKAKSELIHKRERLYVPEVIVPSFAINADLNHGQHILAVSDGAAGYQKNRAVIKNIRLSLAGGERMAVIGKNGSGKSSFLKALLNDEAILKQGDWQVPPRNKIGYLCQHYSHIDNHQTVLEQLLALRTDWTELDARTHLNTFLFRKNNEVLKSGGCLSGGEKARLSLSLIAAHPPRLLILDEVTNNLDLETKAHVMDVLKGYPGAMIVVSHEYSFLEQLAIDKIYEIKSGLMTLC
jgi:ATPase subunit of ABC transporter with duplicated ATPase domains